MMSSHVSKLLFGSALIFALASTVDLVPYCFADSINQNSQASEVGSASPQSGVKLLQFIFQKLGSVDQIAMAKNAKNAKEVEEKAQNAPTAQTGQLLANAEPTNQLLSISPPQQARQSAVRGQLTSTRMRSATNASASAKPSSSAVAQKEAEDAAKHADSDRGDLIADNEKGQASNNIWERRDSFGVGGQQQRESLKNKDVTVVSQVPKITEFQSQVNDTTVTGLLDKSVAAAPGSAGKLARAASVASMEGANGVAGSGVKSYGQNLALAPTAPPLFRDERQADFKVRSSPVAAEEQAIPMQFVNSAAKKAAYTAPMSKTQMSESDGQKYILDHVERTRRKIKQIEIALLPPNVFAGIPLMRLGASEAEAEKTLRAFGKLDKQNVSGWQVWSVIKPHSNKTSLQIYMRAKQVQAIRVFDNSFIAPDFGLKLGNSLTDMKEKFGQPSFIIPEPLDTSSRDYVYPISQVAFQLVRSAPNESPKLTSLLIFSIK